MGSTSLLVLSLLASASAFVVTPLPAVRAAACTRAHAVAFADGDGMTGTCKWCAASPPRTCHRTAHTFCNCVRMPLARHALD
eukprot:568429-Prymnesium_polylepis.1